MTEAVAHRGPDDASHFADGNVAVGFRRLSIIDLAGGQQPMWNERRSVLSVCNGEIFNHCELREWLEKRGHCLMSKCDVEVLPHLYEEFGFDLVDKLNGQFAFAIYDRERRVLFVARDHFGVVPLFYTTVDGMFLFASEIKALLRHPAVSRAVDVTGLDQILCFPGLVSPNTLFAGVRSLSSGHLAVVSERGVSTREYWDLVYPVEGTAPTAADESYYIEGVKHHLERSVRRRLMSDVPVGIYLSGGLDSAVVAALACRAQPAFVPQSFSVSFKGDRMCEQRHQRRMTEFLRTTHHDLPFDCTNVLDELNRVLYHTECPIKESYDTACLALSKVVKDTGVSVVLTGEGADELFGGYIGYRFDKFYLQNPAYDRCDERERQIRWRLWGDPAFGYDKDYVGLQLLKQRLYSKAVRALLPANDALQSLPLRKDRVCGRHVLHKRSYLDFKLRLADHLLGDHGDRMAMANAVEIRHPFLDIDLVNFVTQIPPELQLKGLTEKYVLRQVAESVVPQTIARRQKFGWFAHGTPQLLRLGGASAGMLFSMDRVRRQGYFDTSMMQELISRHGESGFTLQQPFESDLLLFALSFTALVDIFDLPCLN
jgi:asparagine synthase (glutamine-hydrolysing)